MVERRMHIHGVKACISHQPTGQQLCAFKLLHTGPPTQLFARAADFSDVTTDCDATKFYETFFCSVFGIR